MKNYIMNGDMMMSTKAGTWNSKTEQYKDYLLSRYNGKYNEIKRVQSTGRLKKRECDLVLEFLEIFCRADLFGMHERGTWATGKGPRTFWRVSFYLAWRSR